MICKIKPYEGDKPYIFFSYCHEDSAVVYTIIEKMNENGYRIWYDEGIHLGADWPTVIAQHLVNCAACIACISSKAVQSHNCRNEMTFALENKKNLITVQLDQFPLPLGIRLQLASTQRVKAYEYTQEDLYCKLMASELLKICIGEPNSQIRVDSERVEESNSRETVQPGSEQREDELQRQEEMTVGTSEIVPNGGDSNEADFGRIDVEIEETTISSHTHNMTDDETELDNGEDVADDMDEKNDDGGTVLESAHSTPILVRLNTNELFFGKYPVTYIGRVKSKCDIYFKQVTTMSSRHVEVIIHKERNYLKDCNSSNGTFVNGAKLETNSTIEIPTYAEISLSHAEPFFLGFDKYAEWVEQNMMLVSLLSIETGERLYLFEDETVLGRSAPWALGAMTNKMIGRQHAILKIRSGKCYIFDQSKNGTYVNNNRIDQEKDVDLFDGDKLRIGRENFVFSCRKLKEGTME
jgi:pSer/pThr/pTyr-binding forkhead associated (FHA) protein